MPRTRFHKRRTEKMSVTKDMIVTDILAQDESIASRLMQMGMHCIGCMAAGGESLEDAMYVHGYSPEDVDKCVEMINDYLREKESK